MASVTRSYGTGSLRQRKSGAHAGRWEYRLMVDGIRRTATWHEKPTRAQVAAAVEKWSNTLPPASPGDTVGEFLEKWLRDGTAHLRSRTVGGYRILVVRSVLPSLGNVPLVSLSTPQIQRWINNGGTGHALAALRAALSEAVRWGLIPANPARGVRLPKRQPREPVILSPEQTRKLLESVKGDPYQALWVLAVYTGMRQGELLGLRWRDVDLDKGTLTVSRSLWMMPVGPKRREPVLTEPKTKRSRRTLVLAPAVTSALVEHRKRQLTGKASKDGLVFTAPDGVAVHPSWAYDELRRKEKAAGLPVTTFHALRHSAASMLISSGIPLPLVSEMLGHASTAVTMTVYSHVIEEQRQVVADRMGELLSDAG